MAIVGFISFGGGAIFLFGVLKSPQAHAWLRPWNREVKGTERSAMGHLFFLLGKTKPNLLFASFIRVWPSMTSLDTSNDESVILENSLEKIIECKAIKCWQTLNSSFPQKKLCIGLGLSQCLIHVLTIFSWSFHVRRPRSHTCPSDPPYSLSQCRCTVSWST